MSDDTWLVTEVQPPTPTEINTTVREAGPLLADPTDPTRGAAFPRLSVVLRDAVCHDVQKMFGGAEIRVDALVVRGNPGAGETDDFYMPGTYRFSDIHDHQPLPIDPDFGLLLFDGQPAYFLDVFLIASRDRSDTDDLASLLHTSMNDEDVQAAAAGLLGLVAAVPTAAAIVAAIGAAAMLGDLAYKVVKAVSPKTIGMYRGSFLQFRDGFGVGRHPGTEGLRFASGDLEFWFETVLNEDEDGG